jgi:hypothetical protein
MNGEIGAESQVGKGNNFWFTFESREDIKKPILQNQEEET